MGPSGSLRTSYSPQKRPAAGQAGSRQDDDAAGGGQGPGRRRAKRVIVVDTSNEIAGDGDIPHRGIGRARRMQVSTPALQHAVMIEAVENHMPEVIIVDEIGTELDANAARTIAERGVQLIATAHGNTLDNLIVNPTLADLVGGIQSVTLGDDEARRRRTQKTVLERRAPPTFDVLVEIQSWTRVAVHPDVAQVVDRMLRGHPARAETRTVSEDGGVEVVDERPDGPASTRNGGPASRPPDSLAAELEPLAPTPVTHILPYGVNKGRLQQVVTGVGAHVELVDGHRGRGPAPHDQELLPAQDPGAAQCRAERQARLRPEKEHDAPDRAVHKGGLQKARGCGEQARRGGRDPGSRGCRLPGGPGPETRRPEPTGRIRTQAPTPDSGPVRAVLLQRGPGAAPSRCHHQAVTALLGTMLSPWSWSQPCWFLAIGTCGG